MADPRIVQLVKISEELKGQPELLKKMVSLWELVHGVTLSEEACRVVFGVESDG